MLKFPFLKQSLTPSQQLVKLNCLLAEYIHTNHYSDSLKLFTQIHSSHFLRPDHYSLATTLKACSCLRAILFGNQLHGYAVRTGLKAFPYVGNSLLSLYDNADDLQSVRWAFEDIESPDVYSWTILLSACTKLGNIDDAYKLFDQMPRSNTAIWNAIISGCAKNGYAEVAISLFREMHLIGVRHDNYTFASILSLCNVDLLDYGRHVHAEVIKTGFLIRTSVINSLITMYFNCGNIADGHELFEVAAVTACDHVTFNVMIDGLVQMEKNEEAVFMFKNMQEACLCPSERTFLSVMSGCSSIRVGSQVHAQTIKRGFLGYISVNNATITMYSSCKDLEAAQFVFDGLEAKDLVSWNAMISIYAQQNLGTQALFTYLQMRRVGIEPDEITYLSLIVSLYFSETVEMIHSLLYKYGLMTIQIFNALVSAYSRHGNIKQAFEIFSDIPDKNLVSWNAIISGFLINGLPVQGLEHFSALLELEIEPNTYTLKHVLSICASISALRQGKQVHSYILRHGFSSEVCSCNALMTMYAKCGVIDWCLRVFNTMVRRDIVSWNALISAYAQHGQGIEAVCCFEAMQNESIVKPDQTTFTAILSACSHAGLVDAGTRIFNLMINSYSILPTFDHFSCIVDLLGRGGYLDEAEGLVNRGHLESHSNIWWSLFSACAAHANLRLGRLVAEVILQAEQNNPSAYVLLSNIYAAAGQWEEAANLRDAINKTGVMKNPGCSWIGS